MMNIGAGEIAVIAILALLILGPSRLPEFARGIGKFIREFRKQTDDVRNTVEREFYKMDREVDVSLELPRIIPAMDLAAREPHGAHGTAHGSGSASSEHPSTTAALPAPAPVVEVTAANSKPAEPSPVAEPAPATSKAEGA